MNAQRVGVSAIRRVATGKNVFFTQTFPKLAAAQSLSTTQVRPLGTAKLTVADANEILVKQRLQRPTSPHLSIYRYDQTWLGGSIWQRFTGGGLSAAFYVFMGSYLAAPLLGWHLESASLAAAFGGLPVAVKGGLKFLVSWPFVYHSFNGIRHLLYDLGYGFAKKQIKQFGWVTWSVSLASTLGLVFLL